MRRFRYFRNNAHYSFMIPYLTLAVELVKGIAWPLVIFAIVYLFRRPLKELLPRVRKAGPTGVEIEVQQTQSKCGSCPMN
jgi:hypothetical protein